MRELLIICDTKTQYARRLSEYISVREKEKFEVRQFTSADIMRRTLEGKKIRVLLIDENSFEELGNNRDSNVLDISCIYILTDRRSSYLRKDDCNSFYEKPQAIYRFQSAERIRRTIISHDEYCGQPEEDNLEGHSVSREWDFPASHKDIKARIKERVQERLLIQGEAGDNETLKIIDECIQSVSEEYGEISVRQEDRNNLRNSIFYSVRGLDVLEELIADETITEIMVNGEDNIFYERNGCLFNSGKSFDSRERLLDIIRKIVSDANRMVNMSSPIVDARLKNGSRVNAVLEPVSLDGPILTIRRFPKTPLNAEKLISMGAVSEEIMEFLRMLVFSGYNILISGSTGSGKTTFLNILSGYIPKDERIITIEDSAELKIMGIENLVRLEARNANSEGCNEITIRDLIKSALRMRPDRIIVGECRGAEAIDMLQSFLVGQDGSMSTIHANSAEDAIYRLEMLMMINGAEIPLNALRRQIAAGVNIVIQLGRLKDKSRKLLEVREITGYEEGEIKTQILYRYENGCFRKYSDITNTYKLELAGNEL